MMTISQKLRIAQKISSMRFFLRVHNGNKCFESYDTWKVMISYDAMEKISARKCGSSGAALFVASVDAMLCCSITTI